MDSNLARNFKETQELAQAASAEVARLAEQLKEVSILNRQIELQRRRSDQLLGAQMRGDIEGVVVAEWVGLNNDGTGTVLYNDKKYKTVPLKDYSLAPGRKVQMYYEKGTYYSKF